MYPSFSTNKLIALFGETLEAVEKVTEESTNNMDISAMRYVIQHLSYYEHWAYTEKHLKLKDYLHLFSPNAILTTGLNHCFIV